jgi:hypothetical protein
MINSSSNLSTSQFYNQSDVNMLVEVLQNTLELQKELLHWHYHLGHFGFQKDSVADEIRCAEPTPKALAVYILQP